MSNRAAMQQPHLTLLLLPRPQRAAGGKLQSAICKKQKLTALSPPRPEATVGVLLSDVLLSSHRGLEMFF